MLGRPNRGSMSPITIHWTMATTHAPTGIQTSRPNQNWPGLLLICCIRSISAGIVVLLVGLVGVVRFIWN